MFNIKSAAVTYPPVREASREVANLTEKNLHTPAYGVKEFVCPSFTVFSFEINTKTFAGGMKFAT